MTAKRLKRGVDDAASAGYSGLRRRALTQTVWGADICPVETDGQKTPNVGARSCSATTGEKERWEGE